MKVFTAALAVLLLLGSCDRGPVAYQTKQRQMSEAIIPPDSFLDRRPLYLEQFAAPDDDYVCVVGEFYGQDQAVSKVVKEELGLDLTNVAPAPGVPTGYMALAFVSTKRNTAVWYAFPDWALAGFRSDGGRRCQRLEGLKIIPLPGSVTITRNIQL